ARPPSLSLVPGDPRTPVEEAVAGGEAGWSARGVTFARRLPGRMAPLAFDPVRGRTAGENLCRHGAGAPADKGRRNRRGGRAGAAPGLGALRRRPGPHAVA